MQSSFRHLPRVLPYLRPYKLLMFTSVLLTLLMVLVSLAEPWPLAFLVDSALGEKPAPGFLGRIVPDGAGGRILFAVAFGLALALVSGGVNVLNSYVQTRLEQKMILDFRKDLFEHVQKLSMGYHDNQRKGMLMFALNYQAASVGEIASVFLPLVQAVLTLFGMFFVAYQLDPRLAVISLGVVPFIYYSAGFYAKRIEPRLREVREMEGTSLSIVHEAMSMLRVIVTFRRERYEHRRFSKQSTEAVDARVRVTVWQTMFGLAVNLITACGTALVIGSGALLVLRNQLTVGELLVVLAYVSAVYQPLEQVSTTFANLQEQLISLEGAMTLYDTSPEVQDPDDGVVLDEVQGRLTFEHVNFNYSGRHDTLQDLTFEAEPGTCVGIVGPTGAGKSTLVSLVPRFFDPKGGRVLLDGHDLRDIKLDCLRESVSVVLQEPLLFSGTIADNIRYGKLDATDEEVEQAARDANVHDFISRLPDGYQTVLGERGAQLSGGERQRISIARAFLKDAPILILDEPTSSVDSRTEGVILGALRRLMVGRTTLMIAHRLSTIRHADTILVINDGRIEEVGSHDELIERGGLYREMYGMQEVVAASSMGLAAILPGSGDDDGFADDDGRDVEETVIDDVIPVGAAPVARTNGNGHRPPADTNGHESPESLILRELTQLLASSSERAGR